MREKLLISISLFILCFLPKGEYDSQSWCVRDISTAIYLIYQYIFGICIWIIQYNDLQVTDIYIFHKGRTHLFHMGLPQSSATV